MTNPQNIESLHAPLPEVLTETQQAFVDFVMRHSTPVNRQYSDAYDAREGVLEVRGNNQLVPVDEIQVDSFVRVETQDDALDPLPVPYHARVVHFKSKKIDLIGLSYDGKDGWQLSVPEWGKDPVTENYAKRIVDALIEHESAGQLSTKESE